jgi:hypothetical protein
MQSFSQQAVAAEPMPEVHPATPFRPEPFVPEHLFRSREAAFTDGFGSRYQVAGTREGLAAAFRKAVVGATPRPAFERVKDFYRATGHAWARGLSR